MRRRAACAVWRAVAWRDWRAVVSRGWMEGVAMGAERMVKFVTLLMGRIL